MTVREIVEKYLGQFKEVSAGNLQVKKCPFCGREKGKFYVREDTGVYICHSGSCGAKGNLQNLVEQIEKTHGVKIQGVKKNKTTVSTNKSIQKLHAQDFQTLLNAYKEVLDIPANKYLASRGIDPKIASSLNTLVRKKDGLLSFFYQDVDMQIKAVKYRSIYEKKMFQEAGSEAVLWNINNVLKSQRIIICEGEFDCMILAGCGFLNEVVSVPMGVDNLDWIDRYKELLETKQEIILAFDNDKAGERAVLKVTQRLQYLNLKKIDLGDFKDVNDYFLFNGKDGVEKMINTSKEVEIQGIEKLYEADRFDINDMQRFTTGITSFDKNLRGFKEGELVILAGDNGSGKTTLSKQIMLSCRNFNKKIFVVNGEIQSNVFKEDLFLQANGNCKLVKVEDGLIPGEFDYKVDDKNYALINNWLKDYIYTLSDQEQLTSENVLEKIKTAILKNNCFFIIVDNLSVIKCLPDNSADAKGEFASELKNLATKYGVCIMLVNHFTKGAKDRGQEAIKGSGKITDVADIVCIIERLKDEQYDAKLRITKNRLKGKIADVDLYFDGKSKCFIENAKQIPHYNWDEFQEAEEVLNMEFPF